MAETELAARLRRWRDRTTPAAVGLPTQARRRAAGLRREELAGLAGLSVNYLARLEQGRAEHPSRSIVESLARALRLDAHEHDHLMLVAGHAPAADRAIDRRLTPGVQRVLDRLADVPVMVTDPAWDPIAWNPLAAALLGDPSAQRGRERNVVWRHFLGAPSRVRHTPQQDRAFRRYCVASLQSAVARHPGDPRLRSLVADLRRESDDFDALWRTAPDLPDAGGPKTLEHPTVGTLTLDCDVLAVDGSDVRIVVYSAEPGSPDEQALELVGVVGLQDLAV